MRGWRRWSVIDRTPKNLLREIILYNDASVEGWLQKDLDDYMKHMPKVVKLIKSTKREGLIRARTNGTNRARGHALLPGGGRTHVLRPAPCTLRAALRHRPCAAHSARLATLLAGAKHADGDIIVFLDSHCEASDGWYEPIAQRIKESRNTIICPTIDSISDQSIEYNGGGGMAVGGFHWYGAPPAHRQSIRQRTQNTPTPTPTPVQRSAVPAADCRALAA